MTSQITIYTHGACSNNGQLNSKGGWAAIIANDKKQLRISAGESATTNQRMELKAAIEALKVIRNYSSAISIITDNRYLQQGCEVWLKNWKARGWKRKKGESIINLDLWIELDLLLGLLNVSVEWLPISEGQTVRYLVHDLAVEAITRIKPLTTRHRLKGN